MTARRLSPYLTFDGTAREAMEFYQGVFGGELTVQTIGEGMPSAPPETADNVMHSVLKTDDIFFMASDDTGENMVVPGNSISLSLDGTDKEGLTEVFNKLSDGGEVILPLRKETWGDTFGMLRDKFGMKWMVNISDATPP